MFPPAVNGGVSGRAQLSAAVGLAIAQFLRGRAVSGRTPCPGVRGPMGVEGHPKCRRRKALTRRRTGWVSLLPVGSHPGVSFIHGGTR